MIGDPIDCTQVRGEVPHYGQEDAIHCVHLAPTGNFSGSHLQSHLAESRG
jgi:hypothetical protein